jgi:hypothetical protein
MGGAANNASGGEKAVGGALSGGTQGNATGGAQSTGGSASASGGVLATGGANNASDGGSSGAGTGGSSSGGKAEAGSGGVAGSSSAAGGSGSGGRVGAGGAGGATAGGGGASGGNAGSAGSSGNGGAGGASSDTTIAGKLDGALITYPCGTGHSGFDCDNVGCSNGKVTHTQTFQIGGDSGSTYNLTFRVRGIVEAYNYVGGTRDAGDASITKNPDLFLRGGAAQPAGASGSDYDVYELDVSPAVPNSPNTYFLNSVTNAENPHTSGTTLHLSFAIDYTKTIPVMGGGTITVKQYDSNCKSVMNCGPVAGNSCAAPRKIDLSGASPAPSSFTQPYQMPTGAYPQWLFFDVTSVTKAP